MVSVPSVTLPSLRQASISKVLLVGLVLILLLGAFFAPRMVALGSFVTADEPAWGKRSAGFYYSLINREFSGTYQTGHPGVITMWMGAAAYHLRFPEFSDVGQVELGDTRLFNLFHKHNINPMQVMATGRLFVVIANVAAVLAAFPFAVPLLGLWPAVFAFLLIAFDPFHVAHSRYLHTNGLLSSTMFLSLVAFLYYLRTRRWYGLAVSAAAGGLSYITITPGFFTIPVVVLLALGDAGLAWWKSRRLNWQQLLRQVVFPLAVWGLISLMTVYIVWPAMWVNPVGTLSKIIRYALSAAEGEIGGVHLVSAYTSPMEQPFNYFYFYPLTYLWRTTPVVLIGVALALVGLLWRKGSFVNPQWRWVLSGLFMFVIIYTAAMSMGEKKFDRYYLPVYLPLDLAAGIGWAGLVNWLGGRWAGLTRAYLAAAVLAGLAVVQIWGTWQAAPYYLPYYNPLMGGHQKAPQVMLVGWGEGLNEAALYLEQKPDPRKLKILSWYSLAFTWYSDSLHLKSDFIDFTPDTTLEEYQNFDYLVLYINQIQRGYPPALLAYLETQPIEHSVWIDGVEYARIYRMNGSQPEG